MDSAEIWEVTLQISEWNLNIYKNIPRYCILLFSEVLDFLSRDLFFLK